MKIPNGWRKVRFGDVVHKVNDKVPNRDEWAFKRYIGGEHFDEGEIRVTRSNPIEGNEEVIGSAFHMRFKPGQVLYVTRNPRLRKGGMVDFEGVCSNVSFVMEADETQLLQSLLPFIIQTEDFVMHTCNNAHGSTNPFLNWKDIAKYEFLLPPIEEQKKISEVLWSIDNEIKSISELITNSKKFNKKFMKELLFSKKHKLKLANKFLKLEYGSGLTATDRKGGNIPVIGSTGTTGYHNEKLIDGPAVIIGRKGNAGNVIYVNEDCFPIDTTYYVKINKDKALLKYVYYLLKNSKINRFIEVTAVPGLNRNYVHNLQLPLPEIRTQKEMVFTFEKIEHKYEGLIQSKSKLINLRNKLSNELLLGKLRLEDNK
jgi:type I restriction enzyme, S subunit